MEAAADLFVEENIMREALDTLIGSNREFAHTTRAFDCIQGAQQEIFTLIRVGFYHLAGFKAQADACHLAPLENSGVGKNHLPLHAIFHRAGKYFAIRLISRPVAVHKHTSGNAQVQIGFRPHHMHTLLSLQPVNDFLLPG